MNEQDTIHEYVLAWQLHEAGFRDEQIKYALK